VAVRLRTGAFCETTIHSRRRGSSVALMIANIFGGDGLIVVVVALVVLFGGSQLPKLAKNVGSAGREFRKAQQEADEEAAKSSAAALAAAPAPVIPPAPVAPVAAVNGTADDDKLVISRADLRQELSSLLEQRQDKADKADH
jgi:sec-independent protein translocase protein TatA